jgi:predicted SAM-dependent methyltransferase
VAGVDGVRLNLGAADRRASGYISVDIAPPADQIVDLSVFPWPWEDSSVEAVIAHDILEHIAERIQAMNNLHRILRPGGQADIIVPNAAKGAGFWQDPTHKAGYCMNSFQYYQDGSYAVRRLAASYGITARFDILKLEETMSGRDPHEEVWKIHAVLAAVK